MKNRILLISILILSAGVNLSADYPVAQFLLVNPSARGAGMGTAYTSIANDSAGMVMNPCASVMATNSEIYFSNVKYSSLEEINPNTFFGFISKSRTGSFGWGMYIQGFYSGAIPTYDHFTGGLVNSISENDTAFALNLGFKLTENVLFGMTGKIVTMFIDGRNEFFSLATAGAAFSSDLGFVIKTPNDRVNTSITFNNLGGKMNLSTTVGGSTTSNYKEPLPSTMRMGVAVKLLEKKNLILSSDYDAGMTVLEKAKPGFNMGLEYSPFNWLAVRIGMIGGTNYLGGGTSGLGLKLGGLVIDFGTVSRGEADSMTTVAFRYMFAAGKAEEPVSERNAEEEMRKAKEAVYGQESEEQAKPIIRYRKDSREKEEIITEPMEVQLPIKKSEERMNIAIAEFSGRNVSSMEAAIVSDFLRGELVKSEQFNVLDRQNMEKVLNEQKFQLNECTTEECAVQMGRLLNVKKIVSGSLSKLLDKYYITINIIDVETGKIEYADKDSAYNADEISTACERLGLRIAKKYQ